MEPMMHLLFEVAFRPYGDNLVGSLKTCFIQPKLLSSLCSVRRLRIPITQSSLLMNKALWAGEGFQGLLLAVFRKTMETGKGLEVSADVTAVHGLSLWG